MATGFLSATREGRQDLAFVGTNAAGIPYYYSGGSAQGVWYNETDAAVGTGMSLDNDTGLFVIDADTTFSVSAFVVLNTYVQGASVQIFNVTDQTFVGYPVPLGTTLVFSGTTPAESGVTYKVMIIAPEGTEWEYPSWVVGSNITIQIFA